MAQSARFRPLLEKVKFDFVGLGFFSLKINLKFFINNPGFAEKNKMMFFETSAKNDFGIKELFNSIAKRIHEMK